MNRGVRLLELLQAIGEAHTDISYSDYNEHAKSDLDNRTVHRDELITILGIIRGPTDVDEMTVNEIRDEIRHAINRGTNKASASKFSTGELFKLTREINHTQYLDAEDVDINLEGGENVIVDGVTYEENGFHLSKAAPDESPYESYGIIYLNDKRHRLMILHGLDKDECKYDHSVALEKARDYGPYKRWKKDSYVKEIEVERYGS